MKPTRNSSKQKFNETNYDDLDEEFKFDTNRLKLTNWVTGMTLCATDADGNESPISFNFTSILFRLAPLGISYNSQNFPAMIWKFTDPKATILLFPNGRIVCTGTKTLNHTEYIVLYFTRKLMSIYEFSKLNITVKKNSFHVANLAASYEIQSNKPPTDGSDDYKNKSSYEKFKPTSGRSSKFIKSHRNGNCENKIINLASLSKDQSLQSSYDPDTFPGVAISPKFHKDMNIKVIVFSSGSIIITGGQNKMDLINSIQKCLPTILNHTIKKSGTGISLIKPAMIL